jgi:hypothetical protein
MTDLHRELSLVRIQVGQPATRTHFSLAVAINKTLRYLGHLAPATSQMQRPLAALFQR